MTSYVESVLEIQPTESARTPPETVTSVPLKSVAAGLTAHAGASQTNATPLPSLLNEVTTVASVSNSVILPAAVAGMVVRVANAAAANQMNVYPKIGEKMLGVSNAAFAVPAGKSAIFFCVVAGNWYTPTVLQTTTSGLTAHAGASQTGATLLPSQLNEVTSVVSATDSCILPPSVAGLVISVANADAANSMNVYPQIGESMKGALNTAFAVANGKVATFLCAVAGNWYPSLSA